MLKQCKKCGLELELRWFYNAPKYKDKLFPWCKLCKHNYKNLLCKQSKHRIQSTLQHHKYMFEQKFKTPYEVYELLLSTQNKVCAVCYGTDKNKRLSVDHDHKTGKIRGLLCSKCNRALGYVKDSKEILQSLIYYLK